MHSREAKDALQRSIRQFVSAYRAKHGLATAWGAPLIGFADANSPYMESLRDLVSATHFLPRDFLPGCTVVLAYFLPFAADIGRGNRQGEEPSPAWVTAYCETNRMFPELNGHLTGLIAEWGYRAVSPQPVGMIDSAHVYSNWSQRHMAYAAGLGTFGVNNMLITAAGTCGRFYSLVTDLPVRPDAPLQEERCLYKRSGACGLCVRRCPIHALDLERPFDREACAARLGRFETRLGADACGKCTVGLPCTERSPIWELEA